MPLQLDFLCKPFHQVESLQHTLTISSRPVPIQFVRNPRARRYILRLTPVGTIRATIPSRGSIKETKAFTERNMGWITRQFQMLQQHPSRSHVWQHGSEILYRGATVTLQVDIHLVTFEDQTVRIANTANVRPAIEQHLWRMATKELSQRTLELAALHNISIRRITVRNQRSRWGSCSRRGTIALNWRLIQVPAFVRDYIVLHELMHRREANHSQRFWQQVATVCPDYAQAKQWLKQQRGMLR